ncbi:MAG: cytochrome c peroxidase [Chitinophagaceae bacterium]
MSCASCHKPEFAFADTAVVSRGVHGRAGTRNAPSAMNVSARESLFWDGRAATLEEQALGPIANPVEMNLPVAEAVKRLKRNPRYRSVFLSTFRRMPDARGLATALASFERTLETSNTPNDRWLNEEPGGLTEQQIRGRDLFREKARCFECHFSPDFTGDEFRSIGLFNGRQYADSGRFGITHDSSDLGKMRVPGLRNVAMTAPYMHDGSFKTLREVIDYYDDPMKVLPDGRNRDSLLREPLHLSEQEKQDLESFLHALTDDRFRKAQ